MNSGEGTQSDWQMLHGAGDGVASRERHLGGYKLMCVPSPMLGWDSAGSCWRL